jgi:hypothetical protein
MYKWAFIYTIDDGSTTTRVDVIGTLVCVGVPHLETPQRRRASLSHRECS